mgnify:CR=1 FL=1
MSFPFFAGASTNAHSERTVLRHDKVISNFAPDWMTKVIDQARPGLYSTRETPTPYEYVSSYNNFYEFGAGKGDPISNARRFRTDPWSVEIAGDAEKIGTFTLEDILSPHHMEERIYRLRCVEAWSMVVPWIGFPLADLVKDFKPLSSAKYLRFETLYDPAQMPGQRSSFASVDYPYVEGLRMDEATNELAFLDRIERWLSLPLGGMLPASDQLDWKVGS